MPDEAPPAAHDLTEPSVDADTAPDAAGRWARWLVGTWAVLLALGALAVTFGWTDLALALDLDRDVHVAPAPELSEPSAS
ncbi:MAG: hypothetical protein H6806_04450 [Planctomycetes bacterium]|nr:hypothetical protein [Planctomycetota bacterium]MCB9829005.1 hypothetical protein [Planctomycetota bacterium]